MQPPFRVLAPPFQQRLLSLMILKKPFRSRGHLESVVGLPRDQLAHLVEAAEHLYSPFDRRVVRNGRAKWRHIDNPLDRLKVVQSRLNDFILGEAQFPREVVGGVRKRSSKDHANFHVRQPVVVALDLADYFPNVTNRRVFDGLRRALGCSEANARVITQLTTLHGHVPQGAPTSTTMANIASLAMFQDILSHCRSLGLRCSFYIDDIAISGKRAREAIGPVRAIVRRYGHTLRKTKTEIMPRFGEQTVANMVVNSVVSNGPKRIDEISAAIHLQATSHRPSGRAARRIRGQVAFARWINAGEGSSLEQLAEHLLSDVDAHDEEPTDQELPPDQTVKCTSPETCRWQIQSKCAATRE